jgi:hypothetical protein
MREDELIGELVTIFVLNAVAPATLSSLVKVIVSYNMRRIATQEKLP